MTPRERVLDEWGRRIVWVEITGRRGPASSQETVRERDDASRPVDNSVFDVGETAAMHRWQGRK
jgi:hypothetical protein